MRVLMVCTDAEIGGAERFLASLASAKQEDDTLGLVVLMERGSLSDQLEKAFDEVHYLGFPPSSRDLFGMVRAFEHVSDRFKPDIISSHLFHADLVVALSRSRTPKTTTVHTQGLSKSDHPLTRIIARTVGLLSFRFTAVIPASSSEHMTRFTKNLRMRNVIGPIPNGASVPVNRAFQTSSRRIVSLARNHPVKGHMRLFEAFAAVADDFPEWVLDAYGTDVSIGDVRMQTAIEAAGASSLLDEGRITLGGPIDNPEYALSRSSALVISSVYGEAFPIVGAEAAGAGIPVITTDLGSCAEFVDDKRFLVPPDDASALADAFRLYFSLTDGERDQLSALARERAKNEYDPQIAYMRYKAVFTRLVHEHGS